MVTSLPHDGRAANASEDRLNADARRYFTRDGFVLLPAILTIPEVEQLRSACLGYFHEHGTPYDCGMTQADAFGKIPAIRWLLTKESIKEAFRFYCGDGLVYCHHSDVHLNKYTGWHKDACGNDDFNPIDGDAYGIFKMAFYLQDHGVSDIALSVREGSHRLASVHDGKIARLTPKRGDAILFDCRISHCGEQLNIASKLIRTVIPSNRARSRFFGRVRRLLRYPDRLAIFFTLGRPNRFLDEHVRVTIARQLAQSGEESYELPEGLEDVLRGAGIKPWSPMQPLSTTLGHGDCVRVNR